MKKTIFIMGGTRGIGKALVDNLSKDYNIFTMSRSSSYIECSDFLSMSGNISKKLDVYSNIKKALIKFKRIDILINNVGIMKYDTIEKINEADFNLMFDINVKGALKIIQKVLPIMKRQKEGHIINIGSTRAITGAPNKGLYSMTKFALRSLTQTIQKEYKEYGIKSTIICPGAVNTESTRKKYTEKELKQLNLVEEQDIGKTVRYLISLSKNAYIPEIIIGGQL